MLFHFLFYILYLALKVTAIIDNKVKLKFQLNRNLKYTFLNNYKKGQKNTKTDKYSEKHKGPLWSLSW